jgi:hypothetical protein
METKDVEGERFYGCIGLKGQRTFIGFIGFIVFIEFENLLTQRTQVTQ